MSPKGVIAALVATAIIGATASVDAPAWLVPDQFARLFPDGRTVLSGQGKDTVIVESETLSRAQAWIGAPGSILASALDDPDGDYLRTTVDMGSPAAHLYFLQQLRPEGLVTLGFGSGEASVRFAEPRLDVPRHLRDGLTWSGDARLASGSGSSLHYEGSVHADGRCWRVDRRDVLAGQATSWSERRCPGEGLTAWTFDTSAFGRVPGDQVEARLAPWRDQVETAPVSLSAPDLGAIPTTYGGGRVLNGSVAPVWLGDGWARASLAEVLLKPRGIDVAVLPGGQISAMGASGDVLVVATTRRQVHGYTPQGRWLWTADVPDAVMARPLSLAGDSVVVTTLAGDVIALDVRSGHRRWAARVPGAVQVTPAVTGNQVVVGTSRGTVVGLGLDGTEHWRQDGTGAVQALAARADAAVVADGDGVSILDSATGEQRWRREGTFTGVALRGPSLLALGEGVVTSYSLADDVRQWQHALGCESLATIGAAVLCGRADGPVWLDQDGAPTASPTAPAPVQSYSAGPGRLAGTTVSGVVFEWGGK